MKNTRMKCYSFKFQGNGLSCFSFRGMGFFQFQGNGFFFFNFRGNGFSISGEWVLGWMLGKNMRMKMTQVRVSFLGLGIFGEGVKSE